MYKITVQDYGSNTYPASNEKLLTDQHDNAQQQQTTIDDTPNERTRWIFFLGWYSAAILVHIMKGGHNGMTKYMKELEHGPPPYSSNALGNLFVLILYSPRIIEKLSKYYVWNKKLSPSERASDTWGKLKKIFGHWSVYGFMVACFLRAFCKDKALDWTSVIFVQLMLSFTPFVVILTTSLILRKDKLRWQVIVTLLASTLGSIILILGESTYEKRWTWFPDWSKIGQAFHRSDVLGIFLASVAAVFYGLSTVFVDYAVDNEYFELTCEDLFIAERILQGVPFFILAVAFGDLSQFKNLSASTWIIFFASGISNYGVGAYLNIYSTAKLGAPTVGLLSPIRIVSALFISMILMNETISNSLELLGLIIIGVSLICYMIWKKYNDGEIGPDTQRVLRNSRQTHMEPFSKLKLYYY
jgi:drug/metabolite transporter (DMT)-like permease